MSDEPTSPGVAIPATPAPEVKPPAKGGKGFLLSKLKQAEKAAETSRTEAEQLRAEKAEWDKKLSQAQASAQNDKIRFLFEKQATAAGVHDTEAAYKLADLSKVSLDESGALKGADDVLTSLKESKGYLFDKPSASRGSAGGNPTGGAGLPEFTPERIRSLSSADFNALAASLASGQVRFT